MLATDPCCWPLNVPKADIFDLNIILICCRFLSALCGGYSQATNSLLHFILLTEPKVADQLRQNAKGLFKDDHCVRLLGHVTTANVQQTGNNLRLESPIIFSFLTQANTNLPIKSLHCYPQSAKQKQQMGCAKETVTAPGHNHSKDPEGWWEV